MNSQLQSPLFQIPAELTLTIIEYAVQEPEPLLLNCGCDSSYEDDYAQYTKDIEAWEEGRLHPPEQPALTKTCSIIRDIALPAFYKMNSFQAHYCDHTDREMPSVWLGRIGPVNRGMIRDLCFVDFNPSCDIEFPDDFIHFQRRKIFKKMGGVMETLDVPGRCCHKVTFPLPDKNEYVGLPELFAL